MANVEKPLEGLLKNAIAKMSGRGRISDEEMSVVWKEVVGESAFGHSRPKSMVKGRLIVNVDHSGWLYELTMKKGEILERLAGKIKNKKIREIRFRIGDIR